MTFLWPGLLVFLFLIPLLGIFYIWMLKRRKRYSVHFSSLSIIRVAIPKYSWYRRHLPFVIFLLSISCLTVAMARPAGYVRLPASDATIILALDVSRSMRQTDIYPSRLEAAQTAALSFIRNQAPGTQIGIVAFSGYAEMIQSPTTDTAALRVAIESLTLGRGTAIGRGILRSIDVISSVNNAISPVSDNTFSAPADDAESVEPMPDEFLRQYAPAIIVVLTDGVNTTGPHPLEAAREAANRGIRTYTIGFGTINPTEGQIEGQNNPGSSAGTQQEGGFPSFGRWFRRGLDEDTLLRIAAMTGGEYYLAESAKELEEVFRALPTDLVTRIETQEVTFFFTTGGIVLLLLAVGFSLLWRPL